MIMRYLFVGSLVVASLNAGARDTAPASAPTVDSIVKLLKKLEADQAWNAVAE